MRIVDLPNDEKPRERLIKYGVDYLSNIELLSIILRTGTKNKSVIDLSSEILKDIETINNIEDLTINKLIKIKGLGTSKACTLLSSIELGKRLSEYKTNNDKLNNSEVLYCFLKNIYRNIKQEIFIVICLDSKKKLINYKKIFKGTLDEVNVHPREILKYAVLESAHSIIICHNHPSGDVWPSEEDKKITKIIKESCNIFNIPLLDHIIYSKDKYYSFYVNGEL